jgi:hypothetical protein
MSAIDNDQSRQARDEEAIANKRLHDEVQEYEALDAYGKRDYPKDKLVQLFSDVVNNPGSDVTWSLQLATPIRGELEWSGTDYS